MFNLEKFLNKIVKYGLYAILLTPLAFYPRALYGFMTPKFLLFQVLVEIVFGAWLILAILHKEYRPRFSWLLMAIAAFAGISLISALFGVDLQRSIWGIGARMTGLFAEFHFLAWFLVLVSISKSGVDFRSPTPQLRGGLQASKLDFDIIKYLDFSFAICILVALTALYQNTQWHLVYGYTIFSNPTFVAPYFLFHFFWGLYRFIGFGNLYGRLYFFGGSILIAGALILGQVRGAMIGLLAGILFIGVFLIFSDIFKKHYRIAIAGLMVLVVLSLAVIFIYKDSEFVKSRSYLDRIGSISLSATTAQTRIITWRVALKGFFGKPMLGVGPENFNYLFNANYNPRLLMFGGSSFAETWQDKPHSAYLEILTETGVVGGLAYILIWLCVAFYLFRIFSAKGGSASGGKRGEKFLSVILAGAFIAYLIAMTLSFDSFGSWFGLFLFLAALASVNHKEEANFSSRINFSDGVKKAAMAVMAILVIYLILFNYAIWRANIADADALRTFADNPASGIALFKKSLGYNSPYKTEYQFDLIATVGGAIEKGLPLSDLENTVNFALNEADSAILAHPNNASGYTDMLRVYNIFGTLGRDPEILDQAELYGQKSLKLSPNRQETLFYLARTALLKNNPKLAVQLTKQAVDVDPVINVSHWYLGLAYIANNQAAEGVAEIKKALELGYPPKNDAEKNFIKNLGL